MRGGMSSRGRMRRLARMSRPVWRYATAREGRAGGGTGSASGSFGVGEWRERADALRRTAKAKPCVSKR